MSTWNYLSSSAIMSFFALLPQKKKPAAAFVIPASAFYLLVQNCDDEPSVGLNEDEEKDPPPLPWRPPPRSYHLCTRRDTTSRVLLCSVCCWGHKLAKHEESRHDTLRKTSPKLGNTLVADSYWPKTRQAFMHLFTKVRAVNINSPIFFWCFLEVLLSFSLVKKAGQQKASTVVRSHRAPPLVPAGFSCTFSARQCLTALLELLLLRGVGEREGSRGQERGGEKEGARMMGQVWNLHTPQQWLISALLGSLTHYLLVEVRESVGDRRCESASGTVYSPLPKCCLGGSEMCTKSTREWSQSLICLWKVARFSELRFVLCFFFKIIMIFLQLVS